MSCLRNYTRSSRSVLMSITDVFAVGIGPSSSHTVGPMRAAGSFANKIAPILGSCTKIRIELYGSLALTGKGHATDIAVMLGLMGHDPASIDPSVIPDVIAESRSKQRIFVSGIKDMAFVEAVDLIFHKGEFLPFHPNALRFSASSGNTLLAREVFYSIGGGAIVSEDNQQTQPTSDRRVSYGFSSAAELLEIGRTKDLTIAEIVRANERAWRPDAETDAFLDLIRATMMQSIALGCSSEGILPGGLNVRRRAPAIASSLRTPKRLGDPLHAMDWVSLFALAVNEENAAGGRIVTAPTNGAAGIIPAVLKYFEDFCEGVSPERSKEFLLTAAAVGMLYKMRASISAAEMGCQGEVGVACSMAAAALAAVSGGTNEQIANAAEIGMEHNLGLTCDPVGGLVQVPCIERNTMGAVKAINAARLALMGDGKHIVSLDAVIETMRQIGEDMSTKYKETSTGGLAINVVAC